MERTLEGFKTARAFLNTTRAFKKSLPILMGVLMLLSLADVLIPKQAYRLIFSGNWFFDPLVGAALGSISGGNPLTSYIIGGELRQEGVSMLAITAFIVSWVTVSIRFSLISPRLQYRGFKHQHIGRFYAFRTMFHPFRDDHHFSFM